MIMHFVTADGRRLNIRTSPDAYNYNETEYEQILVTDDGFEKLERILDFNMVDYCDDLEALGLEDLKRRGVIK